MSNESDTLSDISGEKEGGEFSNDESICHSTELSSILSKLYLSEKFADITFIIEGERIPAHRLILAARSEYFRALLYGGFSESTTNEIYLNVNLEAFKVILEYIYVGTLNVSSYKDTLLVNILKLAAEYDCVKLLDSLFLCFNKRLNWTNVFMYADVSFSNNLTTLLKKCLNFIDLNIFKHPFVFEQSLSKVLISKIISHDSFSVDELKIFEAILFWSKDKNQLDIKFVLSHVRFTLLQIDQVRLDVARTNLLSPDEIEGIIRDIKTLEKLPYRCGSVQHRNQLNHELIGLFGLIRRLFTLIF